MNSEWFIRFASSSYLYVLLPSIILAMVLRRWLIKPVVYRYALGETLRASNMVYSHIRRYILYALRLIVLMILAVLIARPQLVDSRSKIKSEGVDIVLVLDVSGSMQVNDFDDHRTRVEVAKDEAIRFVKKRSNDAIGLVLFAHDALSRVPLTLDKLLLVQTISALQIGDIDPDGTKLTTGIVTAVNRLKTSTAKSKIMVVLTDGAPAPDDLDPSIGIEIAKKYGVKIYTVGIGSKEPKIVRDIFGRQMMLSVNKELLQNIAHATGGQCFMVGDSHDMRTMYDTIDTLETSQLDVPVFSRYYDLYQSCAVLGLLLLILEIILSSCVWFSV